MRIDIPVNAHVVCTDADAGTSVALIVDPVQRRLTHVVVRERGVAGSERLVPADLVDDSSEDAISLRCTRNQVHEFDYFTEAHFVDLTYAVPALVGPSFESQLPPLVISNRVPEGEVALGRGAVVEATDHSVGHLQSVIVEPANYRITHVVVRTHHFLSHQEVAVPVVDVERFLGNYVLLRVDRADVEKLPHVALHDAYLLRALGSGDHDLVPEGPHEAGMGNSEVDVSHLEGAHLLADQVRARLRARGFSDEQILDWAKVFLRSEHSGRDVEFLAWVRRQERASKIPTSSVGTTGRGATPGTNPPKPADRS